jgi:predicted DNA-binding ArsR family transcriptional regulator
MTTAVTAKEIQQELIMKSEEKTAFSKDLLENDRVTPLKEKVDRLRAIGFKSAKEEQQLRVLEAEVEMSQRRDESARRAAEKYPGFKYIHREVMDQICKKYMLKLGEVAEFTGEVPQWALDVIEKSNLVQMQWGYYQYDDIADNVRFTEFSEKEAADFMADFLHKQDVSNLQAMVEHKKAELERLLKPTTQERKVKTLFRKEVVQTRTAEPMFTRGDREVRSYMEEIASLEAQISRFKKPEVVQRSNLMIAAPILEMDGNNALYGRVRTQAMIENKTRERVIAFSRLGAFDTLSHLRNQFMIADDPIVCIPFEEGYIVITAWGEEGQDTRVFNAEVN